MRKYNQSEIDVASEELKRLPSGNVSYLSYAILAQSLFDFEATQRGCNGCAYDSDEDNPICSECCRNYDADCYDNGDQ
ncbi:MAG: hypothetical protein RSD67_05575 [Oscillospiraceae bacterium]